MIKNFQPFGENVRKPQGGFFLTHTVDISLRARDYVSYPPRGLQLDPEWACHMV